MEDGFLTCHSSFIRFEEVKRNIDKVNRKVPVEQVKVLIKAEEKNINEGEIIVSNSVERKSSAIRNIVLRVG